MRWGEGYQNSRSDRGRVAREQKAIRGILRDWDVHFEETRRDRGNTEEEGKETRKRGGGTASFRAYLRKLCCGGAL